MKKGCGIGIAMALYIIHSSFSNDIIQKFRVDQLAPLALSILRF